MFLVYDIFHFDIVLTHTVLNKSPQIIPPSVGSKHDFHLADWIKRILRQFTLNEDDLDGSCLLTASKQR